MSTLILEDLNLVSLKQLLEMVDCEVKVGKILDVIGDREIFSQDQAKQIVAAVEHADIKVMRHVMIERLVNEHKGSFKGVIEIDLDEFAPQHITPQTALDIKRFPWVGKRLKLRIDTTREVVLKIISSTLAPAFWPKLKDYCDALETTMSVADLQQRVIDVFTAMNNELVTIRIQNLANKVSHGLQIPVAPIEIKLPEMPGGINKECMLVIKFAPGRPPFIYIRNPFLGEAFWPSVDVLNTLPSEIQDSLVNLVVAELATVAGAAMRPSDIFKPS